MLPSMSPYPQLQQVLTAFPEIRLAVLFGSVARGEDAAGSDWDLGVLLEGGSVDRLWDVEIAAVGALRRTVDLVDLHRAPPLLRFEIARDGVVLVEREPGEWTRFKARAMLDWWDWAPTARAIHRIAAERQRRELSDGPA